jgi:cell division septation protein DedD
MLGDGDSEKEILLGNKQLLGIFFLVVILLGVAFAGGYRLGQGSHKSAAVTDEAGATATSATNTSSGETHAVAPEGSGSTATNSTGPAAEPSTETATPTDTSSEPPLGARTKAAKPKAPAMATDSEAVGPAVIPERAGFAPQAGQTFLQVAAVQRDEAEAISEVLRKKGFHAHAVPKPASKLYRVIIGPVRDTSDLSATRAQLRNTGFREIFVQRY